MARTIAELMETIINGKLDKDTFVEFLEAHRKDTTTILTPNQEKEIEQGLKTFAENNHKVVKNALGEVGGAHFMKNLGIDLDALEKKAKVDTSKVHIDGTRSPSTVDKEAGAGLHKKIEAKEYARHVDFDGELHNATKLSTDKYGYEVKTNRDSQLGKLEADIKKTHEALEKAREKLERPYNADPKSSSGKNLRKEIQGLEKRLETLGKSAQKEVHFAHEELSKYREGLEKAHDLRVEKIDNKATKLREAVEEITHEKIAKGQHTFDVPEEMGKEILVKTEKGQYLLSKKGIEVVKGEAATGKNLDSIKAAAKQHISDHYDAEKTKHTEAYDRVNEELEKRTEHIKTIKEDVSTKTGIGEHVPGSKSTPSKVSPGGANALEKGIIGEKAYKELPFISKIGADVKANWHSGGFGKAKVGVGVIMIADGARRLIKTLTLQKDPATPEAEGSMPVQLAIASAEVLGGFGVTRMGGGAIARG